MHVTVRGKLVRMWSLAPVCFWLRPVKGFILKHELLKDQSGRDAKGLRERLEKLRELSEDDLRKFQQNSVLRVYC